MFDTYYELSAAWKQLRHDHDLAVREVACVGAPRTLLCVEVGDFSAPCIALASGVHGDERSGPRALFELVARDVLDMRFSYRIWPCMNPTGYDNGTRQSAEGVDLNRTFGRGGGSPEAKAILTATRDRRFLLSLDLHEDLDATGFYCYSYGDHGWAHDACNALQSRHLPLEEDSIRTPDSAREIEQLGGFSYSLALARRGMPRVGTLEAPGKAKIRDRIAMLEAAVLASLTAKLLTPPPAKEC